MSVRGLTPLYKWGFGLRPTKFLVPLMSNNILVSADEAVATQQIQPAVPLQLPKDQINIRRSKDYDGSVPTGPNNAGSEPAQSNVRELLDALDEKCSRPSAQPSASLSTRDLTDDELVRLVLSGQLLAYKLEDELGDCERAVIIRRRVLEINLKDKDILKKLPYHDYDYAAVKGQCCENVVGYVPIPVGVAGPLRLDGEEVMVPMATTEGTLIASTQRGMKAISSSGGARSAILSTGMTRAPVVSMPTIQRAAELKKWLETPSVFTELKDRFNSTTRFGSLTNVKVAVAGHFVYIRFKSTTGDAMGMNMLSKGCEKCLSWIQQQHPDMKVMSLSGNFCTDKKSSSVNWTDGRGRSVVCEAIISKEVVSTSLHTSVEALVELNTAKNYIGSAVAGSLGGFNAHAANLVTAVFLATGQDVAQNVESSSCITIMERTESGDLSISVTLPSLEVGTVGGGTTLPAQATCLDVLKAKGPATTPGANADRLARIIAATVLAGELSLMSALAAGHLVKSHMRHNRRASTAV